MNSPPILCSFEASFWLSRLLRSQQKLRRWLGKSSPRLRHKRSVPRPSGLNFADFHIGINRQLGVTGWRARWRRGVLCQDLELCCPGTVDLIAVPVALGVRHAKRTGGDQLVERGTVAIQGDVAALRLRDLQQ